MLGVCTVDTMSIHFYFFSETVGAESKLLLSEESRDESKSTLVSEKILVTGFTVPIQYTVSSEVFFNQRYQSLNTSN